MDWRKEGRKDWKKERWKEAKKGRKRKEGKDREKKSTESWKKWQKIGKNIYTQLIWKYFSFYFFSICRLEKNWIEILCFLLLNVSFYYSVCYIIALSTTSFTFLKKKPDSFPSPEILISPPFQTFMDVYVCFLWGLVWCTGRILFLSACLPFSSLCFCFFFLCHCHIRLLPYELSFPLTPLSTSSCKEGERLF